MAADGPATDRRNEPVIDPTKNVDSLVEAAVRRIDDLQDAAVRRLDDLREAESRHVREMAQLRDEHAKDLRDVETDRRKAEADRLDAIRTVDQAQVQRSADVLQTAQQTLAKTVEVTAEANRTQVAAAATSQEQRVVAALNPVQGDIQDLRKVQYEAQGGEARTADNRGGLTVWIMVASLLVAAAGVTFAFLASIAAIVVALLLH